MENNKSLSSPKGPVIEESRMISSKKRDQIVTHLAFAPIVLLTFLGTFTFTCLVISTTGKLLFCILAISIVLFILERMGRRLYPSLKNEEATVSKSTTKKLLAYYAGFLIIIVMTMIVGSYLNTHFLDQDKAARNRTHFEQIFHIDNEE